MKGVFRTAPSMGVFALLVLFVTVWTVYPTFTRLNLDRFGDMLENYAWGIAWQAGYYKHPPLFAWITAGWFSIFPNADWAYYLLSACNAALAIFASWRIALRFLDPWRAFLSVALFFFLPPVTFLAIKYNANAAMLPLWPLTVLFYIRLLERGKLPDAILLGCLAAASVLAKYHSAVLLAAICLHVLVDREARPLLAKAATWIASAVFVALVAPHAVWLFENDFLPVSYAASQGDDTWVSAIASIPKFIGAVALYAAPAALVLLIALLRNRAAPLSEPAQVRHLLQTVQGRALLWTTIGPLVLSLVLALVFTANLSSVWALPMFFSVPILLLLLVPRGELEHRPEAVPVAVAVYSLALMAAMPVVTMLERSSEPYRLVPVRVIAAEIERIWAAHTDAPLAIVAGDKILASGASFYTSSHPYSMQENSFGLTPWVTPDSVKRRGIVVACFKDEPSCEQAAEHFPVQYDAREDITVAGTNGKKKWAMRVFIALPQQTAN